MHPSIHPPSQLAIHWISIVAMTVTAGTAQTVFSDRPAGCITNRDCLLANPVKILSRNLVLGLCVCVYISLNIWQFFFSKKRGRGGLFKASQIMQEVYIASSYSAFFSCCVHLLDWVGCRFASFPDFVLFAVHPSFHSFEKGERVDISCLLYIFCFRLF